MALTRKLLKDMQLEDEVIEQIIAAHASTIEGLKTERDQARAQAEALAQTQQEAQEIQAAFDHYRAQVEQERSAQETAQAIRTMLEENGCNPHAVELIAREIDPAFIQLEGGMVTNAQELLMPLKEKYGAFFAAPVHLPTPAIEPPTPTGGALTREDLSRMSAEEINRNWNAVKGVLSKGVI